MGTEAEPVAVQGVLGGELGVSAGEKGMDKLCSPSRGKGTGISTYCSHLVWLFCLFLCGGPVMLCRVVTAVLTEQWVYGCVQPLLMLFCRTEGMWATLREVY